VERNENKKAFPAFKYLSANSSIAVTPKSIIDESSGLFDTYRNETPMLPDIGVWVEVKQDSEVGTFLVHGPGNAFLFSFPPSLISVSVWDAPTKTSELPLKLPAFSILLYSPVSLQSYLPI
jgi:hypothetical protein